MAKLTEDEIDDLQYFARTGDIEEFNALKDELCKREKVNVVGLLEVAKDELSGNGVLHMAAANGHHGLLRDICKELSNPSPQNPAMLAIINAQNEAGNTALHWAALNGHLDAVKVLIEQGCDPTITNVKGHDAIFEAELNDKTAVVEWVLKEGGEGLEEGVKGEAEGAEGEITELAGDTVHPNDAGPLSPEKIAYIDGEKETTEFLKTLEISGKDKSDDEDYRPLGNVDGTALAEDEAQRRRLNEILKTTSTPDSSKKLNAPGKSSKSDETTGPS